MFWFIVNWRIRPFELELVYINGGIYHAQTTEKQHKPREGFHSQAAPDRPEPVSDLCDKYNLQLTVFYRWQKGFFENGASAIEKPAGSRKQAEQKCHKQLEAKLQTKNEVLSELMEEHDQAPARIMIGRAATARPTSIMPWLPVTFGLKTGRSRP
jgi:hypothetical protein